MFSRALRVMSTNEFDQEKGQPCFDEAHGALSKKIDTLVSKLLGIPYLDQTSNCHTRKFHESCSTSLRGSNDYHYIPKTELVQKWEHLMRIEITSSIKKKRFHGTLMASSVVRLTWHLMTCLK